MPVDPVCGIELKQDIALPYEHRGQDLALSHEHQGKIFFFCCDGCKKIFMKKPKKYDKF